MPSASTARPCCILLVAIALVLSVNGKRPHFQTSQAEAVLTADGKVQSLNENQTEDLPKATSLVETVEGAGADADADEEEEEEDVEVEEEEEREEEEEEEEQEEGGNGREGKPSKPPVRLLSFNLCWECQTKSPFGSGKIAAIHCPAAKLPQGSPPITSCSKNMLQNMASWHKETPFDVIVFLELCNPAANTNETNKWGGFDENRAAQDFCPTQFYEDIKSTFDAGTQDEFVFVLNQQRSPRSTSHTLTGYKKSIFAKYSEPVRIRTLIAPGRPMTALVFATKTKKAAKRKNVMIISIHNIHYRKALNNPGLIGKISEDGKEDPTSLMKWAHQKYEELGGECSRQDLGSNGSGCFSIDKFPTEALAKLFGSFVEKRIKQGYKKALGVQLDGTSISRIIMAGDFNDETSELFNLPIFGLNVRISKDKRKRTCCSDRDKRWLTEYAKVKNDDKMTQELTNGDWDTEDAYPKHAKANFDYMMKQAKYTNKKQVLQSKTLTTAQRAPSNSGIGAGEAPHSRYPFPSDLILDSKGVTDFGFPPRYTQDLGEGTMSDHDPVIATLPPLR